MLPRAVDLLTEAAASRVDLDGLDIRTAERAVLAQRYVDAYRNYCWTVNDVDDLRLHQLVDEAEPDRGRGRARRRH